MKYASADHLLGIFTKDAMAVRAHDIDNPVIFVLFPALPRGCAMRMHMPLVILELPHKVRKANADYPTYPRGPGLLAPTVEGPFLESGNMSETFG